MACGPFPGEADIVGVSSKSANREAVVDIGSNSVRLVIYEGPRRAPMPICNEKALCGLGREMTEAGGLNPAAAEYALATLRRFRRLLEEHGSPPTHVIATAAVREASDGTKFVNEIAKLGFQASIINGAEEAGLAAMGVVSYEPAASGLVGDMGGGSLELIAIENGETRESASLSIGPLRVMQASGGKIAGAEKVIAKSLDDTAWVAPERFERIYSVGGAWRAVARIHMRIKDYPLSVLHHYEVPRSEAVDVCNLVARQSRRSLMDIPGIPQRRLDTLPFAAVALKAVLERTKVNTVVVSAAGVREGLLYRELSGEERALDPLFEGARFFAMRLAPDPRIGAVVAALTDGLFEGDSDGWRRIRLVACALCDIGAYFHPDLRAMQASDTALRAPFYGITHKERVAIAMALHHRHDGRRRPMIDERLISLLSEDEQNWALRLGLAMRFAGALAPKAPDALAGAALILRDGALVFRGAERHRTLLGELPRKRLDALAALLGVPYAEEYA